MRFPTKGADVGHYQTEISKSLDAAIQSFGQAWARGDFTALEAMLSPSYTHNDVSGEHLGRAEWLAYAAGRKGRATTIGFRDVKTRFFGDIAIVTGFNDISGGGALSAADQADLTLIFMQVWRHDGTRWLREAFQATPVTGQVVT